MKSKFVKLLTFTFLFTVLLSISGNSQTYEEYVKQQQAGFNKFKTDQERALSNLRKEFADYVEKHDRDYSAYLKTEWEKFQVFSGEKPPEMVKPKVIPAYRPQPKQSPVTHIPAIAPKLSESPALYINRLPMIQKPQKADENFTVLSFTFCNEKVSIDMDPAMAELPVTPGGKPAIVEFWDKASQTEYSSVVNNFIELKSKFNLGDYGYYMLVNEAAISVFPMDNQQQSRLLFTWFIMVRSGYDVRIAYNDRNIAILIPSYNTIYGKQYISIEGINFYIFTPFEGKEILTYEKTYDPANTPLDFNILSPMNFTAKPIKKTIQFQFRDTTYNLNFAVNPSVIKFFQNYPQVDPEIYFNAAMSLTTKQSIADAFLPVIRKMKESDAVNFLLSFVQHGFTYKTDQEQFGCEKFFFAEEMFHYPAADCEDRSVLFAYLVRHLMSLKMVGLESPEHMFTAIHFNKDAFGDYLTYQGETYIVADPTYINAPFGKTMPSVSLMEARIIPMNNSDNDELSTQKAFEIAKAAGIRKAGNLPNVVVDKSGNFFATGFFSGTIAIGSFSAKGYIDAQAFIAARMDRAGKLLWAENIKCSENATGLAITQDPEGNVYIAGSFSGKLDVLDAGKTSDLFIIKYSQTGQRLWIHSAGLDTIPGGTGLIYSVKFSKDGQKDQLRLVEFSPDYTGYGLFADRNSVIFNGSVLNSFVPASAALALNSVATLDYPEILKKEYDDYVLKQTDRAVAGLFAVSNVIKNSGVVIGGKDVQKAFDKYNPSFRKKCPNMYKLIGRVSLIKNANNIITILTENQKDVLFDKLKLTNNSQLRISVTPDGNARIDAISGIKVGKMVVWYPLNFIQLYSKTGDLLFDYDNDHSQTKMNLRKDILN